MTKTSELSTALRRLADRIDEARLPADSCARPSIEINCFGPVKTREELAAWVNLMIDPVIHRNGNSHWVTESNNDAVDITVWYEPGLLGKVVRERVVERVTEETQDLAGLLAEFAPAEVS